MSWTAGGIQSATDTSLSGITSVTGVTVNVGPSGHKTYQVPSSVTLLTITGTLSWDSDYETLECSEATRIEINAGASTTVGTSTVINGKTRWSKGTGLILNRQQSSPFTNTSTCNIWIKAGTTLANSGKLILNGGRVVSAGGVFCGNDTTPAGDFVTFELNGNAVLQNINTTQQMQMVRAFCEPSGINLNSGVIDGRTFGGLPFSNAGWGTLSVSLEYGNFQCDGNGPAAPVTVPNAVLASNVNSFDYAYVANSNNKANINKYIFKNSDVGSSLRTFGQTPTVWRLGVVELTKEVILSITDTSGLPIQDAVSYMKLNGASINPSVGSRYAGIDDYITPRVYIGTTGSSGATPKTEVLYAAAQGYATDGLASGTALTMDSLTSKSSDVHSSFVWSYDHLVGQPSLAMRGTGTLTQSWILFNDPYVTLSRSAAIAKLASSFSINTNTKIVTVTSDSNYEDLYDALKAFKCSNTQSHVECPVIDQTIVTANGDQLTAYAGWTLLVNANVTLSEGVRFKKIFFDNITINGSITGVYESSVGSSTIWQFEQVQIGTSLAVYDENGVTKYFNPEVTAAGTYKFFIEPGNTGTWTYAVEKYGKKREDGTFPPNTGSVLFYVPNYQDDVGISNSSLSTVKSYSVIDNADKLYDATAAFRLTEQGIKLGQIAERDGTAVRIYGLNIIINQSATSVYQVSGDTLTLKANGYANGEKFLNTVLDGTKIISSNTNEILSADFEDGNGNSAVTILGGDGAFELWKIPTSTSTADYLTGVKLTAPTVGNVKFRFTGITGFDMVGIDINSNVRRRCSMAKGSYTQSFYVGDQIQLAQVPQVLEIKTKVELLQVDLDSLQTAIGTPLQDSTYVPPANQDIIDIKNSVSNIPTADENATAVRTKLPEIVLVPGLI